MLTAQHPCFISFFNFIAGFFSLARLHFRAFLPAPCSAHRRYSANHSSPQVFGIVNVIRCCLCLCRMALLSTSFFYTSLSLRSSARFCLTFTCVSFSEIAAPFNVSTSLFFASFFPARSSQNAVVLSFPIPVCVICETDDDRQPTKRKEN